MFSQCFLDIGLADRVVCQPNGCNGFNGSGLVQLRYRVTGFKRIVRWLVRFMLSYIGDVDD